MRTAVIVPHFRQAEFLGPCLESLLGQTRVPDAIVVVDSSPEETASTLMRYSQRVRHVIAPVAGVAAARNAGLWETDCELVAFLDADNLALPDCLARQAATFERDPTVLLCHGDLVPIGHTGARYPGLERVRSEQVPRERQLGWLLERNRIATDTVCVRRDAVMAVGGFCETPGVREDYDLWLRLAARGRFRYLGAPLAAYRRHARNLSNDAAYLFEWEAGALRRVPWPVVEEALAGAFDNEAERRLVRAEIRLRRGDRDRAYAELGQLAADHDLSAAWFHLGHLALDGGDLDTAARAFDRVLCGDGDDPACLNNRGVVYARMGERERAHDAFARASHLSPYFHDAAMNLRTLEAGETDWRLTRRRLRRELLPLEPAA